MSNQIASAKRGSTQLVALAILGMMFFSIGFALGINSYLIPLLKSELSISSAESYLVLAATFSAFLIFGYPASFVIARIGYKKTMALSFLLFSIGFYLYIPSGQMESLPLFLAASFLSGMGNTFLQATVNPYVTILGPIDSAAQRMSIMGILNKLAWPVAPLFLALVIGKSVDQVTFSDTTLPFYIIIGVFLLLGLIALISPLPEVKAVGEDEESADDCPYAAKKTSVFQFPHLLLGVLALFFYVGVETVALGTLVDYAESLGLSNPEWYAWIAPVGMVVGYIAGIILIPKYVSQSKALVVSTVTAIAGSLLVVLTPMEISIFFVVLIALGAALMWPAIWPLAMTDLGRFTKAGGSLMVVAIVGGALIPTLYGFLKDMFGAQNAYWLCLPLFLYILYYALKGHKIRN
ncbi:glucose/galactose MFS transporter [Marinilabilia salmonicolor]|uniref:glucose/galactose MFS transporter n=3 Tax=Marinilabilia salmonicolor TaxID=989 RepID=UPI00029AF181|nr:glucose/galactose MFS transporter [Marinilabilia salmonicolor]